MKCPDSFVTDSFTFVSMCVILSQRRRIFGAYAFQHGKLKLT